MPSFWQLLLPRWLAGRPYPGLCPGSVARRRLVVEALEDRCTPSTLTVTNLVDHGGGSLRDQITAAAVLGTWTALTHQAPSNITTMILLTDGTVLAQGSASTPTWYKLTPDASGSYVNGMWSQLASMSMPRLYFASNLLPDGRVFLVGGEFTGSGFDHTNTNTGEIDDPVANTWTAVPTFPERSLGDDPSALLPSVLTRDPDWLAEPPFNWRAGWLVGPR